MKISDEDELTTALQEAVSSPDRFEPADLVQLEIIAGAIEKGSPVKRMFVWRILQTNVPLLFQLHKHGNVERTMAEGAGKIGALSVADRTALFDEVHRLVEEYKKL